MIDQVKMIGISDQISLKYDRLRVLVVPISVEGIEKYLSHSKGNGWSPLPSKMYSEKMTTNAAVDGSVKPVEKLTSLNRKMSSDEKSFASEGENDFISSDISESYLKSPTGNLLKLVSTSNGSLPEYDADDWLVHAANTSENDRLLENSDPNEDIPIARSDSSLPGRKTSATQDQSMNGQRSPEAVISTYLNFNQHRVTSSTESNREERIQNLKKILAQQEEAVNKLMKQPKVVLSDFFENNNSYFSEMIKPLRTSTSLSGLKNSVYKRPNSLKRCHTYNKDLSKKRRVEQQYLQLPPRRNVTSRRRQKKFSEYRPKPEYVEMRRKKDLWMSKDSVSKEEFLGAMGLFPAKDS